MPEHNSEAYKRAIADEVQKLLILIGEDSTRSGLVETPERVAKAWHDEFFAGYRQDPADIFKTFEVEVKTRDLVIVRDLPFQSHCEHHIAPFHGTVDIAYLPDQKVLGLSKFQRLVDIFAHRLQIQERLTGQIADALVEGVHPQGVMVVVRADHTCMTCRGVRAIGATTLTSAIRGTFEEDSDLRHEALMLVEGK